MRDEMPWFYEIAVDGYHAIKAGDASAVEKEIKRLKRIADFVMHGPLGEELGIAGKEAHMLFRELPHMMERILSRWIEQTTERSTSEERQRVRKDIRARERLEIENRM